MNRAEDIGAGAVGMQFNATSTSKDHTEDVGFSALPTQRHLHSHERR
jgi:hypothetical protein